MSDLRNEQAQIEAGARELYRFWCEDGRPADHVPEADKPDWKAWEQGWSLNGPQGPKALRADDFREDARAILPFSFADACQELCFRCAPCAHIECETRADCTVDDYYVMATRRAFRAMAKQTDQP